MPKELNEFIQRYRPREKQPDEYTARELALKLNASLSTVMRYLQAEIEAGRMEKDERFINHHHVPVYRFVARRKRRKQ